MKIIITYDADNLNGEEAINYNQIKKMIVKALLRLQSTNIVNPMRTTIISDIPDNRLDRMTRALFSGSQNLRNRNIEFKYVIAPILTNDNGIPLVIMPPISLPGFNAILEEAMRELNL